MFEMEVFMSFQSMSRADYLLELGKAKSLSGHFLSSVRLVEESSSLYLSQKKYFKHMECQNILLRMYRELQDFHKISVLKKELIQLIWSANIRVTARIHYTLGQCALCYGDLKEAKEEFEKSIHQVISLKEKARSENDRALWVQAEIESCFPVYGMASLHIRSEQLKKAKSGIQSLEKLFCSLEGLEKNYGERFLDKKNKQFILQGFSQVSSPANEAHCIKAVLKESAEMRSRLRLSFELLKFNILRMEGDFIGAEDLLWRCYEGAQESKDLCTIVTLFYYLGLNYISMQDYNQANIFLNLAKKSIDSDNFKHLYICVVNCIQKLKSISSYDYDLIVNFSANSIIEKHKGRINFKNRFILLDLLKMFLFQPGVDHSKENMVEQIWKEKYDPSVHDNKVYVTIKRLRELIEPDIHHPRYIFRGKRGYYLNDKMKILLKNTSLENKEVML